MNTSEPVAVNDFATKWIAENKDKIRSLSLRAVMTSPYDIDDFMQMAYCTVLKALNTMTKQDDFKDQIWPLLWSDIQIMTRRSVPTYTCDDRIESFLRDQVTPNNKLSSKDNNDNDIVQTMSAKQSETWQTLLAPGCHTSHDAGDSLTVTDKCVRAAKRMGLQHVTRGDDKYRQGCG